MDEETRKAIETLVEKLKDPDPAARMAAAHAAGPAGAAAIPAVAGLLDSDDKGIAKAANEALERITHMAARPGAPPGERAAAAESLARLADHEPSITVHRTAVRLLQFVGGDHEVTALAILFTDTAMREDVRLTLERIPGRASTRSLERALETVPEAFRPNIEQSLRHRRLAYRTIGIKEA